MEDTRTKEFPSRQISTEARPMEQVLEEQPLNRVMRRQQAKALRTARKHSDALHRICRNIDIPAAIEHFARMNHGKRLNQFDALIAIHRTRLKLPGMTEQESAESLEWLNLQRIPV